MLEFLGNIWASNIGGKLTLIIGAIILVGAIGGVIYAVITKGGWEDRGFMKGPDGKPTKWRKEDLPLTVWVSPALHEAYLKLLGVVSNTFKEVIGREVFTFIPAGGVKLEVEKLLRGHVAVRDDEGLEPNHGFARYVIAPDGYMKSCLVQLPEAHAESSDTPDKGLKITLHEFCHVLGLEHDESIASIMHPNVQQRPQELTDQDKKLLRKTYG